MKRYKADLHIHTALSPCASEEMTPAAIVEAALGKGLGMIAICDHNTAGNVASCIEAAGDRLAVMAGMEITTSEEVHVLGLFPDAKAACAAADEVRAGLPGIESAARKFGEQRLMDAAGRTVGTEGRNLAAASRLSLSQAVDLIWERRGVAIAAHVDRPSFSVTSQLGIFPLDVSFDALEISAAGIAKNRSTRFAWAAVPVVASSDSHFLADIGTCFTTFEVEGPTFGELTLAFQRAAGRRCWYA